MKQKLFLFLALMANVVLFAQIFDAGGINYTITSSIAPLTVAVDNNSAFIGGDAVIPDSVIYEGQSYDVTAISSGAFGFNQNLTSVKFGNSIKVIGGFSFWMCSGLTSLIIPDSVTLIDGNAFESCTNLTSVTIGNSVTTIRSSAFRGCTSLQSLIIPSSVTSIESHAFSVCTSLTSITVNWLSPISIDFSVFDEVVVGNIVLNIPGGSLAAYITAAVWENFNFGTVGPPVPKINDKFTVNNINYSVTGVNPLAVAVANNANFVGVANIPDTVLHNGNTFTVTSISNNAFDSCINLTGVTMSNSLLSIGDSAFFSCIGLTSITIPNSVLFIDYFAFYQCTGLNSVTVNWSTPLNISASYVFQNVNLSNVTLNVPAGKFAAYEAAAIWTDFNPINDPTNNITAPPTAVAQTFCNTATVANLIAVGTSLKWYTTATAGTALSNTATVVSGTYYVSQTLAGKESARTSVAITVNTTVAPTASNHSLSSTATIANLAATGNNLKWYNTLTGGAALATSTALVSGTYYVSQTSNNCESVRTAVQVTIATTPPTAVAQTFCNTATVANLVATGTSLKWYTTASAGTALSNILTVVSGTYYVSQTIAGLESARTSVAITVNTTAAPIASPQSVLASATVANLVATGDNLKWYNTLTAGTALASNTALIAGIYYVSQTINNCESTRTAVVVSTSINYCRGAIAQPLTSPFAAGTVVRWYTVATAGRALTVAPTPTTTTVGTKLWYVSSVINGIESAREPITVNTIALPATPATITGTIAQGALVGTTTTATYSIVDVLDAVSYTWITPAGVNIVAGQGTNTVTVNFANVPAGVGAIGNLSVVAVNSNNCNSLARILALTKALPTAPTAIRMTDDLLPVLLPGIPTIVTSFAQYMGTSRVLTLTATSSLTATSYEWELPAGVNQLSGGTTNVITVNFAGVTIDNTYNYTTTATVPVSTNILRIGVKAKNGTGGSVTANGSLLDPPTTSTARLLTLKAVLPKAPSAIKMTDALAADPLKAVTVISNFIRTAKVFTLTATPSALASSYAWELPAGVTQLAGRNTNTITVNFANVASGTTSLYIGVKAVNGVGTSVTTTNGTLVPATGSTARLLRLTATVPAAVTAVTGQIAGLCGNTSYSYTITPTVLATAYSITAPNGAIVKSANSVVNNTNSLTTSDLIFTVTYPTGFVASTAAPKTLAVVSVNGVGSSLTVRSLNLSNAMPAIAVVTGSAGITNFRRTGTQTFTVADVLGATNYNWTVANGAVLVSGQGTNTVTVDFSAVPLATTTTRVTVVAANSCGVLSAIRALSLRVAIPTTARLAPEAMAVNTTEVYPNPIVSDFNIDIIASKVGVLELSIYTMNGVLIRQPKVLKLKVGDNSVTENVAHFATGVYILQLVNTESNEVITKKLIKQ